MTEYCTCKKFSPRSAPKQVSHVHSDEGPIDEDVILNRTEVLDLLNGSPLEILLAKNPDRVILHLE